MKKLITLIICLILLESNFTMASNADLFNLSFTLKNLSSIMQPKIQADSFTPKPKTTQSSTQIGGDAAEFEKFKTWILDKEDKYRSPGKKALLQNTVLKYPYLPKELTWNKINMPSADFDAILRQPLTKIKDNLNVKVESNWFEYSSDGEYWIDFANANVFGGMFRSYGNTKEERMFMEFPELAQLAYVTENTIHPITKDCPRGTIEAPIAPIPDCAEPFIIFNVGRKFDISKVPYGYGLDQVAPANIQADILDKITPIK